MTLRLYQNQSKNLSSSIAQKEEGLTRISKIDTFVQEATKEEVDELLQPLEK